jgi:hypothetical protein
MAKKDKPVNPVGPTIQRLLKIAGPQRAWLYLALVIDLGLAAILILNAALLRKWLNGVFWLGKPVYSGCIPGSYWVYRFPASCLIT